MIEVGFVVTVLMTLFPRFSDASFSRYGLSIVVVVVVPMVIGGVEIGAAAGKFWIVGLSLIEVGFVVTVRTKLFPRSSDVSFSRNEFSIVVVVVVPMVIGGVEIGAVAGKFWVIGLSSEPTEFVATS